MRLRDNLKDLYNSTELHLGIKRVIRLGLKQLTITKHFVIVHFIYSIYLLLKTEIARAIIYLYGADYKWGDEKSQNIDKKTGNLGYGFIHEALIRNQKPKRILCVGSMYGFIPYMMARACGENGFGQVDFVDAGFDIRDESSESNHFFGQGFWRHVDLKKYFSRLNPGNYLTSYIMTTEEFDKKYHFKYDYIYLDGDHSYKGVVRDLKMFWPSLRVGGYLCLHDIDFNFKQSLENVDEEFKKSVGRVEFGMDKIWKTLTSMKYKMEFSNGYSGIGVILKQKNENLPVM